MPEIIRIVLTMFIGCALFLGLPLVAWGVGDAGGFFGNQARLGYVVVMLAMNTYAAIHIPEVGRPRTTEKTRVKRQVYAVLLLQILSIALVAVGPFCDRRGIAVMGGGDGSRTIGVVLFAGGFLLMHHVEAYLGRFYSVQVAIQEGHRLVTDGPFRYIRHPRYLGIIVFSVGLALVFRSWVGLGMAAGITGVLVWRISDEEALLHAEFGAAWEAYRAKTGRLIPRIF